MQVTGMTGACGKTKRNAAEAGRSSSGIASMKSLPCAPRPCSQRMLAFGAAWVSISRLSSGAGAVMDKAGNKRKVWR